MRKRVADIIKRVRGREIPEKADYKRFAAEATNGGALPASWIAAGDGGGSPAVSGGEPATGSAEANPMWSSQE